MSSQVVQFNSTYRNLVFPRAQLQVTPGPERSLSEVLPDFSAHMAQCYAPGKVFQYHNWRDHIVGDMLKGMSAIFKKTKKYGIDLDKAALQAAIIGHDCLLNVDQSALGFDSKEHTSAHYVYNTLRKLGAPEAFARKVETIIQATHVGVTPESVEQKIIRALDVRNIGGQYDDFLPNTRKLHREAVNVSGKDIPFEAFAQGCLGFLPGFLAHMIQVTPEATDSQGRSIWHTHAIDNLYRLFGETRDTAAINTRCVVELGLADPSQSIITACQPKENEFFASVGNQKDLQDALSIARQLKAVGNHKGPAFFVPGSPTAAPLRAGIANEVHLMTGDDSQGVEEAMRVLAPGGHAFIYNPTKGLQDELLHRPGGSIHCEQGSLTDHGSRYVLRAA